MTKQFEATDDMLASKGQRFLNYCIDLIIIYIIISILTILLVAITVLAGNSAFYEWTQNISTIENYLIFFSIHIPYYTFFECYTSRTISKYITKTMVVNEDGSKLDLGTAFKRTLSRLIPFDGLTYLGNDRGWHDSIPDVYVVQKELFTEKMRLFNSFEEIGKSQE